VKGTEKSLGLTLGIKAYVDAAAAKEAADKKAAEEAAALTAIKAAEEKAAADKKAAEEKAAAAPVVESVKALNSVGDEVAVSALPINGVLKFTVSKEITSASVNVNNIRVYQGTIPVAVSAGEVALSDDKKVVTVDLSSNYEADKEYTVVIKGLSDSKAQLSAEKSFAFKTATDAIVLNINGSAITGDVEATTTATSNGSVITVATNGLLDASTVNGSNVTLNETSKGTKIVAAVATSGDSAIVLTLKESLAADTQYKLSINGVKTLKGTKLENTSKTIYVGATALSVSTTAQTITGSYIGGTTQYGKLVGATHNSTYYNGFQATIGFSTKLSESTIAANVILVEKATDTEVAVTRTYNADAKTVKIVPNADLKEGTVYQIKVKTGLKSEKGKALGSADTREFTTMDLTPVTVTALTSKNGDNGLKVGDAQEFTVTFSENVSAFTSASRDNSVITAGNIAVVKAGADLTALTTSDVINVTSVTQSLTDSKTYTIKVGSGFATNQAYKVVVFGKDLEGKTGVTVVQDTATSANKLATSKVFAFSTEGADVTGPAFSKVYKGNDLTDATAIVTTKTNVASGDKFTFVYDEAITTNDTSKISLEVFNGSAWVATTQPSISYASNADGKQVGLVLTLGSEVNFDKQFRLVVDADAVKDAGSNKNGSKTTFAFTGTAGDDTAAKVNVVVGTYSGTAVTADSTTAAAVSVKVLVGFDENELGEVTGSNISVATLAGVAVAGTVEATDVTTSLSSATAKAYAFKPSADLAKGTTYVVTVKDVKDLAGNTIATKVFSFGTVAAGQSVTSTGVADGAQNVDRQKQIAINFTNDIALSAVTTTSSLAGTTTTGTVVLYKEGATTGETIQAIGEKKAYKVQFSALDANANYVLVVRYGASSTDDVKTIKFTTGLASTDDYKASVTTAGTWTGSAFGNATSAASLSTQAVDSTTSRSAIAVQYSQNIDASGATVTVTDVAAGTAVGTFAPTVANSNTLTVNTVTTLDAAKTYKITVSGVKDEAGNVSDALTFYIN